MNTLWNLTIIFILLKAATNTCLFGQNIFNEDFSYEYKGLRYKSIVELNSDIQFNKNNKGSKCMSNLTDTLKVYFIDSNLADLLIIKDSLLSTLCLDSEWNFSVNQKYTFKHKGYKYFTIEGGYSEIGFFKFALINRNGNSFLLIVIGTNHLSQITKSRIKRMFGYLIL